MVGPEPVSFCIMLVIAQDYLEIFSLGSLLWLLGDLRQRRGTATQITYWADVFRSLA
jgi:hypothetical protein